MLHGLGVLELHVRQAPSLRACSAAALYSCRFLSRKTYRRPYIPQVLRMFSTMVWGRQAGEIHCDLSSGRRAP